MSLSTTTRIQTTWRCTFSVDGCSRFQIAYESADGPWVSFVINCNTGVLSEIENFTPTRQIPFWYTDAPFSNWRITIGQSNIELTGSTVVSHTLGVHTPYLERILATFTASRVCALWSGKLGYQIIAP